MPAARREPRAQSIEFPAAVLIALMIVWLGSGHKAEMPLKTADVIPPFAGLASIVLIVSNFIAFAGLEVNAVHIRELRRPVSDYLKSMAVAVILILLVYILGTVAISVAVPVKSIDLNAGAAQAFTAYANGFGMPWLGVLMSALLLIGALAGSLSWVAGPSRGLLLVGRQGFLPRALQRENQAGVQAPLMLIQGGIVTVLAILFVVIPGVSSAFWALQAMTAILYMLMYILMFIAAWRLRKLRPDAKRLFKVPAMGLVATVGALAAAAAIFIGLIPPSQFKEASPLVYGGLLALGVLVLAIPPQIIYWKRSPKWLDPALAAAAEATEAAE